MSWIKPTIYFLLVFFLGALTASNFGWLQPMTSIEIKNTSGKPIKYLDIEYRGLGDHKGRISENIQHGQAVTFKWATEGEASYRLHVTFDDGTKVQGGAGYTSRGDTVHEVIEASRILSSLPVPLTLGVANGEFRNTTLKQ
jgi:hypothetical protein